MLQRSEFTSLVVGAVIAIRATMRFPFRLFAVPLLAAFLPACTVSVEEPESVTTSAVTTGALIKMDMESRVAVLLDDIPAGPMRDAAAAAALARSEDFWEARAERQIRLAFYRLVFRGGFYTDPKGPLPLPDQSVWDVRLVGTPHRHVANGHDAVTVGYAFNTYIVSDADSPGIVEPTLATVGGTWNEPFSLPTDPDLLLERTGYACMDEFEYPVGSVFEENTWYFFDQTCAAGATSSCHVTSVPQESCVEALQRHTGIVIPTMTFRRVAYNPTIAADHRVGSLTKPVGADLAVVRPPMVDERKIVYRYFSPGSCELEEGVIGRLGWRRLMLFSAVVKNEGSLPIHIGDVSDPTNPWNQSHVYEFSACHQHYHFSHYGNFNYNGAPGSKRAFCLEETNRYDNDEKTPLTAEHQSCGYQGIGAGWGDEYQFGIPGQWVDITDVNTTTPHNLTFDSNPDEFMCEGTPVLDTAGRPIFDPTSFRDSHGNVVSRMRCDKPSTWHANNFGSVAVSSPGGSYVTEPCRLGQIGPNRNCGFAARGPLRSCTVGQAVNLRCTNTGAPQVLRICEKSDALGVGVACPLSSSLENSIVNGATRVSFACPVDRDTGTGGYSVYTASVVPSQGAGAVSCTSL